MIEQTQQACEEAKRIKEAVKHGITKEALNALKKRFAYHLPSFLYKTDGMKPLDQGNANVELIKLHAAVRDGQREVISYIEQIIDPANE